MKILLVLYDDPKDGYPTAGVRDDLPHIGSYPDGQSLPTPQAIDFQPGQLLGSVTGALGLRDWLAHEGHELVVTADKDGPDSRVRARAGGCGRGHLTALLAGLSDRRTDRQGAEAQARHHRRHRLGPCRPAGGDRARHHGRRGHLLQLDQRRRACRDGDPGPGAQLSAVARRGAKRRLGHCGLRHPLVRRRGHACRHRRRRADRQRRAPASEAVRRPSPLFRPASPAARGGGGAGRHPARLGRGDGRGLRRRHDQLPAPSGDGESVRRGDDRRG